jgi:gliding motility-associated-like protein
MKLRTFLILVFIVLSLVVRGQTGETYLLGNVIKSGSADDESYGPYNIGFNFTFFGNTYTQFYVNTNGQILFGAGTDVSEEVSIPDATVPNNFIAALWDDLIVSGTGKILYTTVGASPNRKLIIQATNMGFYPNPIFMGTFLVILYEGTNKIQVQYRIIIDNTSTRAHGGSATIGIENSTGTAGVQYAYHSTTAISTGKAISFTPSGSTYTLNSNATYDPVVLTTNLTLPEPGIPSLLSPQQDAVIGSSYTFEWAESGNSANYTLLISNYSDIGAATSYNAGTNLSYDVSGLILDTTYFWGVFASNATGTTWCEIKRFYTSSAAPLVAVPQTVWVEQNQEKTIKLNYTGGDASAKSAIITSLPSQGQLWQVSGGVKSTQITTVPTQLTDPQFNVTYVANGGTGNGIGDFNFHFHDFTGDSPSATITVNVSPPGMPDLLYTAKTTTYIEMQFDLQMANPAGKEGMFTAMVNGSEATISSLALKEGDPYTVLATLTNPISLSDGVTIAYTAGNITSSVGGYLASFDPQTVTLRAQTISFPTNLTRKFNESPFTLSATASSGLSMTYSSSNLTVATIMGFTATLVSLGTSEITARQAGNATWAPANYAKLLTVSKGDQIITFGTLPAKTYGDADFAISATTSSGLSVSFSGNDNSVATVIGNIVHITGGGTVVITASQAGNSYWNPAPNVPQTLTVAKAGQTISFGSLPVKTYGDADFTISATSSSGLQVSFASGNTAIATVTGNLVHITGTGDVVITASQPGNTNYAAATDVPQTLTINKANQTISFNSLPDKTYGDADFTLGAVASSGLAVSYLSSNTGVATVSGDMAHITGVGNVTFTASQPGNSNYNPVNPDVQQSIVISKGDQTITVTDYPERLLVTQTGTISAISSASLPVSFESENESIASVSGGTVTGLSSGTAQIRAFNDGDSNYNPAEEFVTIEITSNHRDILYLFTPNNDGFNPLWVLPQLQEWGKSDVRVYSRSGKLVYSNPDYNNEWDGTSGGNPVPEGAYYFVIKTENAGTVKGTVNIVR